MASTVPTSMSGSFSCLSVCPASIRLMSALSEILGTFLRWIRRMLPSMGAVATLPRNETFRLPSATFTADLTFSTAMGLSATRFTSKSSLVSKSLSHLSLIGRSSSPSFLFLDEGFEPVSKSSFSVRRSEDSLPVRRGRGALSSHRPLPVKRFAPI